MNWRYETLIEVRDFVDSCPREYRQADFASSEPLVLLTKSFRARTLAREAPFVLEYSKPLKFFVQPSEIELIS